MYCQSSNEAGINCAGGPGRASQRRWHQSVLHLSLFFTFCLRLWAAQTGSDSGLTLAQEPSLPPPAGIGGSVTNLIIGSWMASKHSLRTLASCIWIWKFNNRTWYNPHLCLYHSREKISLGVCNFIDIRELVQKKILVPEFIGLKWQKRLVGLLIESQNVRDGSLRGDSGQGYFMQRLWSLLMWRQNCTCVCVCVCVCVSSDLQRNLWPPKTKSFQLAPGLTWQWRRMEPWGKNISQSPAGQGLGWRWSWDVQILAWGQGL